MIFGTQQASTNITVNDAAMSDVIACIDNNKAERPHLGEFQDAWKEACEGVFLLK